MSVRDAVEAADAAVQADEVTLPGLVREAVERQHDTLSRILPEHVDQDRFEAMTLAAIKSAPKLVRCFDTLEGRTSILYAVIQAASVGLEVNTVAEEAHLIPNEISTKVGNSWRKRWEARLQFGYRGVQKIATRDPRVKQVYADVVMAGDHFVHRRGLEVDTFEHEVTGPSTRELTHAYAVVRFHDAPAFVRVLDRDAVEKRRERSQSWQAGQRDDKKRSSPWYEWEAEQWRKTAIHSIRRELDLSPVVQRALNMDGQALADGGGDQLLAAGGEMPALPVTGGKSEVGAEMARSAVFDETAVQPPGGPPPDPGPDHPSEGPAVPGPTSSVVSPEIPLLSADALRDLVLGNVPAKSKGSAMRTALEAVRNAHTGQSFGTIDDVADHADANRWMQYWVAERDHDQS